MICKNHQDVIASNPTEKSCKGKHIETVEQIDMIESTTIGIIEKRFFVGNNPFAQKHLFPFSNTPINETKYPCVDRRRPFHLDSVAQAKSANIQRRDRARQQSHIFCQSIFEPMLSKRSMLSKPPNVDVPIGSKML